MKIERSITKRIFLISLVVIFLFLSFPVSSVHNFFPKATAEEEDGGEETFSLPIAQEQSPVQDNTQVVQPATQLAADNSLVQVVPSSLPWYITRAAAISAYFLLFLLVVMGESMASGVVYNFITPPRAWLIHKYLGISFGVALLTHMTALIFDNFVNFNLLDIFIPFHSAYNPIFLSFGIVGFYFTLIIILSSIISRFQTTQFWRTLHFLVYPLFVIGLIHGFMLGTDSRNIFILMLYATTGLIFIFLFVQRLRLAFRRR